MPRSLTVLIAVLGLALVAGCGGSDTKKAATTSSSAAPASKAEYESRFGAGLRPAQGAGSLASKITKTSSPKSAARVFDQVGRVYQNAYTHVKPIVPPKEIADLHTRIVAALQGLAQASNRASDALRKNDKAGKNAALTDFRAQGAKIQSLAKQLTARGY